MWLAAASRLGEIGNDAAIFVDKAESCPSDLKHCEPAAALPRDLLIMPILFDDDVKIP